MNNVSLLGRLTRDPEMRYTQSANPVAVARYGIAVNRALAKDGQQQTDFINIVAWGKSAEFASKYLKKGMLIAIEGEIQTGSYEQDGRKVYTFEVKADRQHFAEPKKDQTRCVAEQATENEGDDLPF